PEESKSSPSIPEAIPNEFGVPQDDDWLIDEPQTEEAQAEDTLASQAPTEQEVQEPVELDLPDIAQESVTEDPQPETDLSTVELEDESLELDELELPEFGEEEALAEVADELQPE
ncbi:hypothetical protein, partial [Vibrio bivalvicida]